MLAITLFGATTPGASAHAAAAEQYARYAAVLRDLGVEPLPLEAI